MQYESCHLFVLFGLIDNQIESLPLFLEDLKPKEETKEIYENPDIKGALKSSLESIKKILIIRKRLKKLAI